MAAFFMCGTLTHFYTALNGLAKTTSHISINVPNNDVYNAWNWNKDAAAVMVGLFGPYFSECT